MFVFKISYVDPHPRLRRVLANLGQSLARVKYEGLAPPKGRNLVSQNVHTYG